MLPEGSRQEKEKSVEAFVPRRDPHRALCFRPGAPSNGPDSNPSARAPSIAGNPAPSGGCPLTPPKMRILIERCLIPADAETLYG